MYPNLFQIKTLHQKYAPNERVFDLVFTHCQIVAEIAQQIIAEKKLVISTELVSAGALLHDIGAYQFIDNHGNFDHKNYYKHALAGYTLLKKENFPEEICLIVQRHFGVGLTSEDILLQRLDLPKNDYRPKTIEERLVLYADKFHSKHPRFNRYETYFEFTKKFGNENQTRFEKLAAEFGKPNLQILVEKYHHPLV